MWRQTAASKSRRTKCLGQKEVEDHRLWRNLSVGNYFPKANGQWICDYEDPGVEAKRVQIALVCAGVCGGGGEVESRGLFILSIYLSIYLIIQPGGNQNFIPFLILF